VRLKSLVPIIFGLCGLSAALPCSVAASQSSDVPDWLAAHVGESDGQIAQVVLERARTRPARAMVVASTSSAKARSRFGRFRPATAAAAT